jgi:hypothetical protein
MLGVVARLACVLSLLTPSDVRINGDYADGDVLGPNPPTYIDRAAFQSAPPFTYGNTPRTLAFDLRNPSSFNQDLSGRLRRHPDQHHQRQLRPCELTGQHAARRADQSGSRVSDLCVGEAMWYDHCGFSSLPPSSSSVLWIRCE